MALIQTDLSIETEQTLARVKMIALKNNMDAKSKAKQIALAVKWLDEILTYLDETDLQSILNIKK